MEKWADNKAWFLVLPVFVVVAFSAIIPLMTVVNYSIQDIFGQTLGILPPLMLGFRQRAAGNTGGRGLRKR